MHALLRICSKARPAEPPAVPLSSPRPCRTDYRVAGEIGHGHFSIVFRAVERTSGRLVAIKQSRKPLAAAEAAPWRTEAAALTALRGHPNVTALHAAWAEPQVNSSAAMHFLALELCGPTLSARVKAHRPLEPHELWRVARDVAAALAAAHAHGLAHLDCKPDNILESARGDGAFKLADFGLAAARDGSAGASEGDARYLAAEVLAGCGGRRLDLAAADMFALGASLVELAAGQQLPSSGPGWRALRDGPQRSELPKCLDGRMARLLARMLARNPAARPTAQQVLAECDAAAAHAGGRAARSSGCVVT
eukprot:298702-Chlamydomonas_euryale.AAC.5